MPNSFHLPHPPTFLTEQSDCQWKNATGYLLISRQHLTKTQKDPWGQDQEQAAKLVDGCQHALVEIPRMVCLDLAYLKFYLQLGKKTSKANFLIIFPIAKAG